jgi:hypothetical protein
MFLSDAGIGGSIAPPGRRSALVAAIARPLILRSLGGCALSITVSFLVACGSELDESITEFEQGDCVLDPGGSEVLELEHVSCSEPGALKVIDQFDIVGHDSYPGDPELASVAEEQCPFETTTYLYPTEVSWNEADDRLVVCFE